MKYIEAMIGNPEPWTLDTGEVESFTPASYKSVDSALDAILVAIGAEDANRVTVATTELVAAAQALLEEIDNHYCGPTDVEVDDNVGPPLIPLSSIMSIREQVDRVFLRGDEVAIVRLSDLQELMREVEALRGTVEGIPRT